MILIFVVCAVALRCAGTYVCQKVCHARSI